MFEASTPTNGTSRPGAARRGARKHPGRRAGGAIRGNPPARARPGRASAKKPWLEPRPEPRLRWTSRSGRTARGAQSRTVTPFPSRSRFRLKQTDMTVKTTGTKAAAELQPAEKISPTRNRLACDAERGRGLQCWRKARQSRRASCDGRPIPALRAGRSARRPPPRRPRSRPTWARTARRRPPTRGSSWRTCCGVIEILCIADAAPPIRPRNPTPDRTARRQPPACRSPAPRPLGAPPPAAAGGYYLASQLRRATPSARSRCTGAGERPLRTARLRRPPASARRREL